MLVHNLTDKFPIPHEPGEWLRLKRLSGKQVRACKEAVGDSALDKMRRMGGEVVRAINQTLDEETERRLAEHKARQKAEGVKPDRLKGFDIGKVIEDGLVGWSYKDAKSGEPIPFSADARDTLDPKTERWAAEQILEFSDAFEDETVAEKKG